MAGDQNDRNAGIDRADAMERDQPRGIGQVDVEDDDVGLLFADDGEPLGRRARGTQLDVSAAEGAWKACWMAGSSSTTRSVGIRYSPSGKLMVNLVPPVARFATASVPPWSSTIRRDMTNPSPSPVSLVVTNGWKIRAMTLGGMPVPVSSTSTMTRPAARRTTTVSIPPVGIASSVEAEVDQDLLELTGVGLQGNAARRFMDVGMHFLFLGAAASQSKHVVDHREQIDVAPLQLGGAGEFEEGLERSLHPSDLPFDDFQVLGGQPIRVQPSRPA